MKFRVKTHVTLGEDAQGKPRVFEPGQVVELEDETAKASPWAFGEVVSPQSSEVSKTSD